MNITLENKVAVVTGGGQGLGEQTARTFHASGATVAIVYFEEGQGLNKQRAEKVVADLGKNTAAFEGDVRNLSSTIQAAEKIAAQFGGIDILVNNAAVLRDRSFAKMTEDEWKAVIDTNLGGVFNMSKAALPHLREGGRIINLASIAAVFGFFGQANYASAKAGVVGFTKVLSRELGRKNITVNAVAPGVALTEMGKSIPETVREEMLKQIPLGRFAEPSDIANAILYLASPLASYVTGQTIHVNGGWIG